MAVLERQVAGAPKAGCKGVRSHLAVLLKVSIHRVKSVFVLEAKVGDWGMVARVLTVNSRSVWEDGLCCLSQKRVEWLLLVTAHVNATYHECDG